MGDDNIEKEILTERDIVQAGELIQQLQELIKKHGDSEVWTEGNDCQAYTFSSAEYDEHDQSILIR